jgi:uncharacterized SAM-binding protein YcdF (DUF218 family)
MIIYRIIGHLIQPYTLLILLIGLAILNLWRRRRESRAVLLAVTVPFGLLYVLSLPVTSHLAVGSLEWQYPPLGEVPPDADAIVVLSAGADLPSAERPKGALGAESVLRCMQAVEDYKRSRGLPVVVSGGSIRPGTTEVTLAQLMKEFLVDHGVKPDHVIAEGMSQSTYENAVESGKILRGRGLKNVVVVTDATHLLRAERCFRKEGFSVIPSGCRYRAMRLELSPLWLLPGAGPVQWCLEAFHEWVGMLWYALHGRV